MRPAVKKPQAIVSQTGDVSKTHENYKKENPQRHVRASDTPRSAHIQRFNAEPHAISRKEANLTVATPVSNHHIVDKVAHLATSTETRVMHSVEDIEESLRHASAHLQTFEDNLVRGSFLQRVGFKNKAANLASLSFAGLLLVGFFAYQNGPNIEMRVAATKSGVSAGLPGYKPAGYSTVKDIESDPGKVKVSFKSNTNDKKFTITQEASSWSSETLLNNHVLAAKTPFQTYQDEGKAVYIYNDSNATWVNGGIWYRIEGDASLTSDQLLRIANSF